MRHKLDETSQNETRGKIKIKVNIAHEEKQRKKEKNKSQTLHSKKKRGETKQRDETMGKRKQDNNEIKPWENNIKIRKKNERRKVRKRASPSKSKGFHKS